MMIDHMFAFQCLHSMLTCYLVSCHDSINLCPWRLTYYDVIVMVLEFQTSTFTLLVRQCLSKFCVLYISSKNLRVLVYDAHRNLKRDNYNIVK